MIFLNDNTRNSSVSKNILKLKPKFIRFKQFKTIICLLGQSALYHASVNGANKCIEFLLHAGSDPSQIVNAG